MANVDLYEVTLTPYHDVIEPRLGNAVSSLPELATVSGAERITYYQMIANDSVTAVQYTWVVSVNPDWAGLSYPGPNSATNIAISAKRTT